MIKRTITYISRTLGFMLIMCLFVYGTILAQGTSNSKTTITQNSEFKTLVWSDEFDGEGVLDSEKWFHQTQIPPGGSWWGGLIQHYTNKDDNSYQKNGHLNLVAKKEVFED